ncbi:MAG: hypothetical protein DRJ67_01450 [Thermoprotei archaeon]|nr:MAG: hypothetical protein DRJ67_01450 [Thermoprotei archaeon]
MKTRRRGRAFTATAIMIVTTGTAIINTLLTGGERGVLAMLALLIAVTGATGTLILQELEELHTYLEQEGGGR